MPVVAPVVYGSFINCAAFGMYKLGCHIVPLLKVLTPSIAAAEVCVTHLQGQSVCVLHYHWANYWNVCRSDVLCCALMMFCDFKSAASMSENLKFRIFFLFYEKLCWNLSITMSLFFSTVDSVGGAMPNSLVMLNLDLPPVSTSSMSTTFRSSVFALHCLDSTTFTVKNKMLLMSKYVAPSYMNLWGEWSERWCSFFRIYANEIWKCPRSVPENFPESDDKTHGA